jgi:opacity protein-like surface antigen
MRRLSILTLLFLSALTSTAAAQSIDTAPDVRPGATAGEFSGGYTAFFDDGVIDHGGVGGSARVYVAPRLSVGPELVYMIGPGNDRDVLLLANLTVDLRRPRLGLVGRVEPYLVAGAGLLRHSNSFGGYSSSGSSVAYSWGGGARVWVARRIYVASDIRAGWTPNVRVTGTVGVIRP